MTNRYKISEIIQLFFTALKTAVHERRHFTFALKLIIVYINIFSVLWFRFGTFQMVSLVTISISLSYRTSRQPYVCYTRFFIWLSQTFASWSVNHLNYEKPWLHSWLTSGQIRMLILVYPTCKPALRPRLFSTAFVYISNIEM